MTAPNRNRSSRDQRNNDGYSRQNHRNDFRSGVEFGRGSDRGVTITNVERNSIYYNSGIRQNDVIVSISGRPVRNDAEFYSFIRPGSRVPVIVLRDGRRKTVYITYDQDRNRMNDGNTVYDQSTGSQAYLGVRFETRIRDAAVISAITPGSPAEEAGLQRGDELVAINGQEIRSPQEVTRLIASMQPGATVEIEFSRRSDERTQVMLQGRPEGHSTTQYQQQNVYRGGPQYDRMNRQEFDQDYSNAPANNNNKNNYGRWENGSDRRSTRPLLPRLRN